MSKVSFEILQNKAIETRLENSIPEFKFAIDKGNLENAKKLMTEIEAILTKFRKWARIVELSNRLYELAMDKGELQYAIDGFTKNRKKVSGKTRLYLEATSLLAISHLREGDIVIAQPFIAEVLKNDNVIKSNTTRLKFKTEIIERFKEESILASLMSNRKMEQLDIKEIHNQALVLEQTTDTELLFKNIGEAIPKTTKDILFMVDVFAKKQLTYEEQKLLPSSQDAIKNEIAGKTVFASFKRILHKAICDGNSEVAKAWKATGSGIARDKKIITSAIVGSLMGIGVFNIVLIVSAAALLLRFGLEIYCERYKPLGIMEMRGKRK